MPVILQHAVGQCRFAVVNMGDNTEVTNLLLIHRVHHEKDSAREASAIEPNYSARDPDI